MRFPRPLALATAILAMTTAGILVPPSWASASESSTAGGRDSDRAASRAPLAAPGTAQASLSLTLHAAQPAPTGKDAEDPFLSAVAGKRTILVVSLRALAIADRTSATTAPSFGVTLPAGLTFVSVADSMDPDVSGSWSCTGTTTVLCALGVGRGAPGRMAEGQAAQAILTLKAGARAVPDVDLGSIAVSASVKAQDTEGVTRSLTASASLAATGAASVPPDILVREIPVPADRQRNVLTLRTVVLGDLVSSDPMVTLNRLVPDGASTITVDKTADWTCSPAKSWSCVSVGTLAPGTPSDVTVRFAMTKGPSALQWSVGTSFSGGAATQNAQIPGGFVVRQSRAVLDPAAFDVQIRSPKGQGITIGGDHVLQVVVTNRSLDAYAPHLAIDVPVGLRLAESTAQWTCTGTTDIDCDGPRLAAGADSTFLLRLAADQSTKPGIALVTARVTPGRNAIVRHPLHVLDPGDPIPAIDLRRFVRGASRPWDDGRAINAPVGQDTAYRVVVRNVGGVPLEVGKAFTAGQTADRGVRFVAVDASDGAQCSVTAGGIAWTCTMQATTRRPVGAVVGSVTVTVRPTDRFDQVPLSPVSARMAGSSAEAILEPVQIRGVIDVLPLKVSTSQQGGITVGGTATATMRVRNESRRTVTGVVVVGNLPSGVSAVAQDSAGWACVPSREQVSCTYAGRVEAGKRTSVVRLALSADRGALVGSRLARWRASGISPTSAGGKGATRIEIHGRARVTAKALPSAIGVRPPAAKPTSVILRVESKTPRSRVWHHTWEQACLTEAERQAVPACAGASTNLVRIIEPKRKNAVARIPVTKDDAAFVFKVTAYDGSAGVVDYVTVTTAGWTDSVRPALPRIDARTGLAPVAAPAFARHVWAVPVSALRAQAHVLSWLKAEAREASFRHVAVVPVIAPIDVTRMSRAGLFHPMATPLKVSITGGALIDATTGEDVSLPAIASGGSKPYTYAWEQIVGSKPDLSSTTASTTSLVGETGHKVATYQVTVTDSTGQTATDEVTLVFNPSITNQFCSLWNKADAGAQSIVRQLGGGIEAKFKQLEVIGTACTPNAAFTFAGTTVTFGGFTIAEASGIVTAGGIAVSAGSLSAPASWGLGELQIGDVGLVIALAETSSGAATMHGHFSVRSFAFLPVPAGWRAMTKVFFSASSGQTSMSLTANADGPGGATASLSGSVSSDGTFKVTGTANDIVSIGDGEIDASGTVQLKQAGGSVSGSLKGSLATPATIADGITIPALSVVWDTDASSVVSGTGTLQFEANGDTIDLDMSVNYSSTKDWTLRVKGGGSATWEPVSGLEIQPSDFSGSLVRASGDYDWQIEANLSAPWTVTSALTVSSLSITIANSCPTSVKQAVTCPQADTYLGIAGTATVDSEPADAFTADIAGVAALGGGTGMALASSIDGSVTITSGLDLTNATLTTTYGVATDDAGPDVTNTTDGGFTVAITADVDVASVGSFNDLQVNVTEDGWSFAAFSSGVQLGDADSYGDFSKSIVAYSTMPTTVTAPASYGINPVVYVTCGSTGVAPTGKVCADSVYVAGTYTAPGWFTDAVGGTPLTADALVEVDPSDGTFNAKVDVPLGTSGTTLPTGGSSTLTTGSLFFQLQQVSGHVVVTAGGEVDLGMPSATFGSDPPTLDMDMSYDATSDTLQAALTYNDPAGWQDAFGMPGLDLFELTVALQINLDTLTPALGLSASADLPGTVENAFFTLNPSTPVQAFVDLSLDTPCLGVSIGTQGPDEPVAFAVGGGVLTASFVELYVAPDGCMIGTTIYPVGYRFAFNGTILDVPVAANVEVGLDPVSIDATLSVGSFQVGPLLVDQTQIGIDFVKGVKDDISFSGGFQLFDTGVTASGDLDYDETTDTTSASLDIDITDFGVNGFELKDADINMSLTSSPDSTDIQFDGSASMDILGDTLDIKEFDFTVENNVVTAVSADVTTTLVLGGGISFDGAFNLSYTSSPQDFTVAADVTVAMDDFTLSSAKLSITPSCADVDASLDIPGLISASVGGYVVYGANCTVTDALTGVTTSISGTNGAFCVFVDNVDLAIGGFESSGSASLSNNGDEDCSGTTTTADDIVGTIDVALVLGAQSVSNTAHVSGVFNSDGTYSFTGTDQLNIGGFSLDMRVTAAKDSNGESVEGSAELQMLGNDLTFSGSFSNVNGAVSVVLQAEADPLSVGGFDLGSGMVRLAQTPDEFGMTFDMDLNVGVASMQSTLTFNEVNGDYLFYTYVDLTLGIPGIISASAAGSFTNCTDSTCQAFGGYTLTASVSFTFGGWSYTSPTFEISTGGQFSFSVSDSRCCESTSATDVLGVSWWTANDSWSVSLTVNESGVSGSASGEATIYSQETALKYPCGPWYWVFKDWCSYPVTDWGAVGASASINPWSFCFRIAGSPWICI